MKKTIPKEKKYINTLSSSTNPLITSLNISIFKNSKILIKLPLKTTITHSSSTNFKLISKKHNKSLRTYKKNNLNSSINLKINPISPNPSKTYRKLSQRKLTWSVPEIKQLNSLIFIFTFYLEIHYS